MLHPRRLSAIFATLALVGVACNPKPPTTHPSGHTVASLVPAATDILLAMHAGDSLVAVSNYDSADIGERKLPRVGDYQSTDWETLATLKPDVMIIEMDPGRLPTGFADKVAALKIKLVNVPLHTLPEIYDAERKLGAAIDRADDGAALASNTMSRIAAIQHRNADKPKVRALIAMDERAEHLIGVGEFLNDALEAAGGVNVAAPLNAPYPGADAETLTKLNPQVVVLLKPHGTANDWEGAKQFWSKLDANPHRVSLIDDPAALLPGSHVADIAEAMDRCLHPDARP